MERDTEYYESVVQVLRQAGEPTVKLCDDVHALVLVAQERAYKECAHTLLAAVEMYADTRYTKRQVRLVAGRHGVREEPSERGVGVFLLNKDRLVGPIVK